MKLPKGVKIAKGKSVFRKFAPASMVIKLRRAFPVLQAEEPLEKRPKAMSGKSKKED